MADPPTHADNDDRGADRPRSAPAGARQAVPHGTGPPHAEVRAAGDGVRWCSSAHTVSGDARRLSISATPQGCFCESFGGGAGVVHLTVTMVNPGVILRLTGGLGPLGLMGVIGNMIWEFEDTDAGTRVRFTYAVGGYRAGGLEEMTGPVDNVIGDALARLKAYLETGDAENADSE